MSDENLANDAPIAKTSAEDRAKQELFAEHKIDQVTLDGLKKEFGRLETSKIAGRWFIYRTLKRAELKTIRASMQGGDELSQEEKIVARCLIVPRLSESQLREDDAGVATTLTELIYNFSGYQPESIAIRL